MQLDVVTVQGALLDNVGASEALLQQLATHEVEHIVMWMGQPHAGNQNQGTLPHGRQRSLTFEVCSNGSFIVDGPPGRG
jgi:hypothetical protein